MGIFGEWANEIRTWKIVPQQRLSKVKHFTKGNLGFSGTQTEPNMSGVHTKVSNFARSSIDNSMGLKHGTWKRLGPPNHATDATKASGWNTRWYFHWQEAMTTGWRNKSLRQAHGRQLSTVVAAMQHRREQWVSWAETVEGLETSDLTLLREPWIKNISHVSS